MSPYNKRLQDDALKPALLRRLGFQAPQKHNVTDTSN